MVLLFHCDYIICLYINFVDLSVSCHSCRVSSIRSTTWFRDYHSMHLLLLTVIPFSQSYQITSKYNISIFQKIQIKTYPEEFSRNMYLWMLCHKRTEVIRLGLVTEHSPSPSMEICLCLAQTASSLQGLDGELLRAENFTMTPLHTEEMFMFERKLKSD